MAMAMLLGACSSDEGGTDTATGGDATSGADASSDLAAIDPATFDGEATTITGEPFDLATVADADLVVWFWAPW